MGIGQVRSTGASRSVDINYRFHGVEPLQHLPNPPSAFEVLTRLADDPAIRYIMQQHKFSVGVLTELAPHEHPELLGLNVNFGQIIKLRIRTDAYDGFRPHKDIRRVLCHELTHNVWGDHDNKVCSPCRRRLIHVKSINRSISLKSSILNSTRRLLNSSDPSRRVLTASWATETSTSLRLSSR